MSENGVISIIVSVFKAEEFLARCIDSILFQTYRNIELILVHDPTGDRSGEICDDYARKDSRVKVIHREKAGSAASARNEGLKIATGQYIGFVDSDDWIEKDTLEYSINLMSRCEADIVQYNFILAKDEKCKINNPTEKVSEYKDKAALEYLLMSSTTGTAAFVIWRCVFKAKVLNNVLFRDTFVCEDIDWIYRAFSNAKKVISSNQIKYYYYQSGDSLSTGGLKKKDFGFYDAVDALYSFTSKEDYGKIRYLGEVKKARTEFSLLCKAAYFGVDENGLNKNEVIKELTQKHRKNVATLLKAPIPISRKVLSVLFAINYSMTEKIVHLLKHI